MTRVWDPQLQDYTDEPFRPQEPKKRWDLLFLAIGLTVAVVVVLITYLIVGEGTPSARARRSVEPTAATNPSPTPVDPDRFEQGLAEAIAHVAATEPNVDKGVARVDTIIGSLFFVTDGRCEVSNVDLETFRHRRGHAGYVVRKVQYAPPEWKDQFVGVRVEVTC